MKSLATSYYAIGTKVWYRQNGGAPDARRRGVIEDVTLGAPPVTYYVRLESKDCVSASFAELQPR